MPRAVNGYKICSRKDCALAGQPQPVGVFYKASDKLDGRMSACSGCLRGVPRWADTDLLGRRFGTLTVLARGPSRPGGYRRWVCTCACGRVTQISTGNLTSGNSKSCGRCSHPVAGQRFGRLVVQFRQGRFWFCLCECGALVPKTTAHLNAGKVKACRRGCRGIKIGDRFGGLVVVGYSGTKNAGVNNKGQRRSDTWWVCVCDCGATKETKTTELMRGSLCRGCASPRSGVETELFTSLAERYPDAKQSVPYLLPNRGFVFDIFVESLNTAVEFDGAYWHDDPAALDADRRKYEQCKAAGIYLIRVPEREYLTNPEAATQQVLDLLQRRSEALAQTGSTNTATG